MFVSQRSLTIIEQSCIRGGATYSGRKDAVHKAMGHLKRAPIPILVKQKVCAVPMLCTSDPNCIWVCTQHFVEVRAKKDRWGERVALARIILTNEVLIDLPLSKSFVDKQMERGIEISLLFADY